MFTINSRSGKARSGILHTMNGDVTTPFFMPVNTKGATKFVTKADLEELGTKALISNSFLLSLAPGIETIGDIHDFMNFHGAIFTDCGAFQMIRDELFIGHTKHGIRFKNPYTKKEVHITPRDVMNTQFSIKSDVAMALDNLIPHDANPEEVSEAAKLTIAWHAASKKIHDSLNSKISSTINGTRRQLLFGIGQGASDETIRRTCLRELVKIGFDGYALGGLSIGEGKDDMMKMVKVSKEEIPDDKPIYFMGLGTPADIVIAIGEGIDIFDSAYPTIIARHDQVFTLNGQISIRNKKYSDDSRPLDPTCDCKVCKNHTRKYIHHLSIMHEPTGNVLKSYHNIAFMHRLTKEALHHIKNDTYSLFQERFLKEYALNQ